MKLLPLLSILVLTLFSNCNSGGKSESKQKPYVIMVSFDGFRHDYVASHHMPHFEDFIQRGTSATSMLPSFPSKTFPNHYTLVTGMYPGHHGLVDNSFYSPKIDKPYSIRNRQAVENPAFYGGLPLWQLVQEHGMLSASYFWVGSESPIADKYPDYYFPYDQNKPNADRIDQVIDWLHLPETERPQLITLYFSLVDSQGHEFGPESEELSNALQEADSLLGNLMHQLETVDLPVNTIVVSDHGMYSLKKTPETFVSVPELINEADSNFILVNGGTQLHIYSQKPGVLDSIYDILQSKKQHFEVYRRQDIPNAWHYDSPEVGNLLVTIHPDYYFSDLTEEELENAFAKSRPMGVHGYDPDSVSEMGGIFYAQGPNIKEGKTIQSFRNIHVYPLIAYILGITTPQDIDGRLEVLKDILKE